MWRNVQRWRGVVLIAIAVIATVWMAVGNQLVLYIHPRYIVFTVIMAAIAIALVVASMLVRPDHDDDDENPSARSRVLSVVALVVAGGVAIAMVALPPATLTSATAGQRDITSTTVGAQTQSVSDAEGASDAVFAGFTVADWSSLLRQTTDLSFYAAKPVDVVGFITPDPDDPQNVFYVSRFVVTCCAVDAQPTGIPVYMPNWPDSFATDDWVHVTGEFAANSSRLSKQGIALTPTAVDEVDQPSEPYLY